MNYTLHQLQIFHKVSQLQSITKASEELHLTQPAVSIQLKNFQDQFPIPLTEVVGRKLYITEFGHEIAQASEKILNEVHAINYKTLAYQGELAGRLKISVVSTAKYVMPFFLSDFIRKHPGVELSMDVTNKARVVESVEANEIDFALVSVVPDTLRINRVELMPNRLYYVASPKMPLPGPTNRRKLFEGVPLIYRETGSATRNAMEQFISQNRFEVRTKIELTSNEAVKQAVLTGLGASVMPLIGIKNELRNNDLTIVPIRGLPLSTTWNLIWLRAKKLSPAASAYLDFTAARKEAIIKDRFQWIESY